MADNPFQSRPPSVPQPTLAFFVADKRPHFVNFANELNLQVIQRQRCYISRREFFKVRTTALILICNARAVSRIPALFIARSTICYLLFDAGLTGFVGVIELKGTATILTAITGMTAITGAMLFNSIG